MKNNYFLYIVLFFGMTFIHSQVKAQTNVFDLNQCVEYGLEHSPLMTISKNEIVGAKLQRKEAYGDYLPKINGSGEFNYNIKMPVVVVPFDLFGTSTNFNMKMGLPYTFTTAVQLEQKIYDQSIIAGIQASPIYSEYADLKAQKIKEELIYNTAKTYYQVLVIAQKQELLQANKEQYGSLLKILRLQLDKGVITEIDFNRVKVAYNNITSQENLLEASRKVALNGLKSIIGMSLDTPLEIKDTKELIDKVSLPKQQEVNISNRLDLQIDQKLLRLQEINLKRTKYMSLPTLSTFINYGANTYSENFRETFKEFYDFSTFGVKLTVPIFNGLKVNTAYQQLKLQIENQKANNQIQEDSYKVEEMNSRTQLEQAYTSYQNDAETLELAESIYSVTSLSYQKGVATLTDFLNADYAYKEARNNYTTSMINLLTYRLDYEKSKGNLFHYLNIIK